MSERVIEFRAWHPEEKKMYYGLSLYSGDGRTHPDNGDWGNPIDLSDEGVIVMQFTGLLDKNGKEIYEGDIVKQLFSGYKKEIGIIHCGDIADQWSFNLIPKNFLTSYGDLSSAIYKENAEVIGNIWEHPEILNA